MGILNIFRRRPAAVAKESSKADTASEEVEQTVAKEIVSEEHVLEGMRVIDHNLANISQELTKEWGDVQRICGEKNLDIEAVQRVKKAIKHHFDSQKHSTESLFRHILGNPGAIVNYARNIAQDEIAMNDILPK